MSSTLARSLYRTARLSRSNQLQRDRYSVFQRPIHSGPAASQEPRNTEPFRKQLQDAAKRQQEDKRIFGEGGKEHSPARGDWELTVGIEIHAQLNTERKLFSRAFTSIADEPNSHVTDFDAALPGSQPSFQAPTLIPAINAAIAMNCDVQRRSSFDRKHYFYRDQPAGYQITQFYQPFAKNGYIDLYDHDGIAPQDGKVKRVRIKQIQMEQDTAKTISSSEGHLIDLNRVGHPLIEIITYPDIHYPATAAAFVRKVQLTLELVQSCVIGMEAGGLRADVNVSVRKRPIEDIASLSTDELPALGQRTEIKNLSSFYAVENAIVAERHRQISVLEAGGAVAGETRGWSVGSTETSRLRGKEGEVDYRYMPDPDVPPIYISDCLVEMLRNDLPLNPDQWLERLTTGSKYSLTPKDAKTLIVSDQAEGLFFYLNVVSHLDQAGCLSKKSGKTTGNWVLHELGGLLNGSQMSWFENPVASEPLSFIILQLLDKKITGPTAKHVLRLVFDGDTRTVSQILDQDDLWLQPLSASQYRDWAQQVIDGNPAVVKVIKSTTKRDGKLQFLIGQMMRRDELGRLEPVKAKDALLSVLDLESYK
ncbi:MAG: hypothetical protein M1814_006059 [Vezdaea aestivalis]|nr:MAG: hypothetical protein M1814_006059 [Vezdaea aestivalis]